MTRINGPGSPRARHVDQARSDGRMMVIAGRVLQVYPRSFAGSNGGDLDGLASRLDHLQQLGGKRDLDQPDHRLHRRTTDTTSRSRSIDPLFGGMPAFEGWSLRRTGRNISHHGRCQTTGAAHQ